MNLRSQFAQAHRRWMADPSNIEMGFGSFSRFASLLLISGEQRGFLLFLAPFITSSAVGGARQTQQAIGNSIAFRYAVVVELLLDTTFPVWRSFCYQTTQLIIQVLWKESVRLKLRQYLHYYVNVLLFCCHIARCRGRTWSASCFDLRHHCCIICVQIGIDRDRRSPTNVQSMLALSEHAAFSSSCVCYPTRERNW